MQERESLRNIQIDSRTDSVMRDTASVLIKKIERNHTFVANELRHSLHRPGFIMLENLLRREFAMIDCEPPATCQPSLQFPQAMCQ